MCLKMAKIMSMLVAVFVVVIAMSWLEVSAQTHHVVGGDAGWTASSSGRVFRVGDKISFTYPATEETIVELQSLEDFISCNLANPIRMYSDSSDRHITLEKEGIRYFTSANPVNCKNGLKLPVSVQPTQFDPDHSLEPHPLKLSPEFWPEPEPSFGPHVEPEPEFPPVEPEPEHGPPVEPEPERGPPSEPPPVGPWPRPVPGTPSPPPGEPSASSHLNVFSFVLFYALVLCFMGL